MKNLENIEMNRYKEFLHCDIDIIVYEVFEINMMIFFLYIAQYFNKMYVNESIRKKKMKNFNRR